MKALVLCGGVPQIALMEELRSRGITTVLADMNPNVGGRKYADRFYQASVLDVDAMREIALKEKVDFLITVCADQVLEVVAEVAEELGMPWYIDFETAQNVSKKSYMKEIFWKNGVPTSKFVIQDTLDLSALSELEYPLIVKPVDCYSSRGVHKITSEDQLEAAFANAKELSRSHNVIIEEFVEGDEISVDIYVENGKAHVLCTCNLSKIGEHGDFVIHRGSYPADISTDIKTQIDDAAQRIVDAFGLKNCPMLIQLISTGKKISVVEFCARTGGGAKFRLIKTATGFDVVKAVVDLTLGESPVVPTDLTPKEYITNEFLYCTEGVFDRLEGFDELLEEGVISEYHQVKSQGAVMGEISSSGDRVAYFTVRAETREEMIKKHRIANSRIRVVDTDGKDILRHDLLDRI